MLVQLVMAHVTARARWGVADEPAAKRVKNQGTDVQ
jgi:hypothetical protein